MDRLGAPDQGAIQGVRGPSRWAGPEINLTPVASLVDAGGRFGNRCGSRRRLEIAADCPR